MDLDSRAFSKLIDAWNTHGGSEDYRRILERLGSLTKRYDHEIPEIARIYQDNHLKRCISGNSILNEHARRKEIFKSIDKREFQIWQYKRYILQEEAKINRLHLELFS
ncbi:hypothetical protein C1646_760838 [Rhizophagus diaphanus]|nr:hypothetical protein C1646_760838 [Rhizophagus diaphanus] [Rhizophagus sp. MUCL 43196]